MTHSPAPWKEEEVDGYWIVKCDESHTVGIGDLEDTCHVCHANATLIAAAPELLAALKEAVKWMYSIDEFAPAKAEFYELLESAIAKAEGKQS